MKQSKLRGMICAGAGAVLLAGGALAALSSGDSLISLSYLQNTFLPSAQSQAQSAVSSALQETYQDAQSRLDETAQDYLAKAGGADSGLYSANFAGRTLEQGDVAQLKTGSGLLAIQGDIQVSHDGTVVDVTAGETVSSGGKLTPGHRYLVAEDTTARFTVQSGAADLGLEGSYSLTQGKAAYPFYDVAADDWYHNAVSYVYQNGIFSGSGAGAFLPESPMDRAMMVTVLFHLAGDPEEERAQADATFTDVPAGEWYSSYVSWGAQQGITAGTGSGTFSPTQPVTRQQVAVLLYNFAGTYLKMDVSQRADLQGYTDLDQADDWGLEALSWAVSQGIMSSTSSQYLALNPQGQAKRCEVASMLMNFSQHCMK